MCMVRKFVCSDPTATNEKNDCDSEVAGQPK